LNFKKYFLSKKLDLMKFSLYYNLSVEKLPFFKSPVFMGAAKRRSQAAQKL